MGEIKDVLTKNYLSGRDVRMESLLAPSILAMTILVMLSGMFSASETAFTSASKIKLKKLEEEGNKKATRAIRLIDDYDRLLTTILVGNNLVNIMSSSLCTFIFTAMFGPPGVAYATAFMLVVILAAGEITPKSLAKTSPERFTLFFTPMISFVMKIFYPITWVFQRISKNLHKLSDNEDVPTLTEEELIIMVNEIEEEGELEEIESELIKSAICFDDKTVGEILTPRVDIMGVDTNTDMEDVKRMFVHSGYSRLPVYDGTVDKITGVLYSKDFYAKYFLTDGKGTIKGIARQVRYIPESTCLATALSEIQKSAVQMLVIVDDFGGTVGIVTLEDVLEELVGEIWDESDEIEYDIIRQEDGTFIAKGDANVNELMEMIERKFDLQDYDGSTVGGFIQYALQRSPITGDEVEIDDVKLCVKSIRNRRIKCVKVTVSDDIEP